MDQTVLQVFKAVQAVIHNLKYIKEPMDEHKFYKIAHENGLSGMIFSVLNRNDFDKEIFEKFQKDFYTYHAKDVLQQKTLRDLDRLFNQHQIKYIFLKGAHLKQVYPEPYMRSMGDIDILIEEDKLETVKSLLKSNSYHLTSMSEAHDTYKHDNGLEIEIHPKLTRAIGASFDQFFESYWEHAECVSASRYEFKPEFELVYLLIHMVKHFHSSGVGLRSILDIGLFIRHYIHLIHVDNLESYLNQSALKKFFLNVLELNNVYFDLQDFKFSNENQAIDQELLEYLTRYIISSGVHGVGSSFNNFVGRMAVAKRQETPTLIYVLKLVFPRYKQMCSMYPPLRKIPILLPFFWMIRLIKLSVVRFKRSMKRIRQIKSSKKYLDDTIELYNKLGI